MGGKRSGPPQIVQAPAPPPVDFEAILGGFQEQMMRMQEESNSFLRAQEEAAEQARYRENIATRDSLFSSRNDAINQATANIDDIITREQASAQVRGVDYNITDDERQSRINRELANVWDKSNEDRLVGLVNDYGSPGDAESPIALGSINYDIVEDSKNVKKKNNSGPIGGVIRNSNLNKGILSDDETLLGG